jgi:hypothetical protein
MLSQKFHRLGPNWRRGTHQTMGQTFVNKRCMAFCIHQARIAEATQSYVLHSSPGDDEQKLVCNTNPITLVFLRFGG